MEKIRISNSESWENIFTQHNILSEVKEKGYADVSAQDIKDADGKEPRLMAKIDFRENLPPVMHKNELSIMAIKNGLYRIAKNDPFIEIKESLPIKITELDAPTNIIGIDPFNITSESAALDIAAISGMHEEVFGEESNLVIRGKMRANLKFELEGTSYDVKGAQIEIDGGYESASSIHLIEAKLGYRNNINVRQLLYPQLYWEGKVKQQKKVRSYIFYLQDDIFRFIPYAYDGVKSHAEHSKEKAFKFKHPDDKIFSLFNIKVDASKIDTTIPFPQADKFDRINDMLIIISNNEPISKDQLAAHFDIVPRQIDYYFNVLKWLKLCSEVEDNLILTHDGKQLIKLSFRKRMQEIAKIVFSDSIMNAVLDRQIPSTKMFQEYSVESSSTIERRLQTVRAWITYFRSMFR